MATERTATEDKIAKRRAEMPSKYRGIYDRAMSGKSRVAGARTFCLEWTGWSYKDSANCNTVECPLHPYNPYLSRQNPTERGLASRQSTNGLPVALVDSQIAKESQGVPVTRVPTKEKACVA